MHECVVYMALMLIVRLYAHEPDYHSSNKSLIFTTALIIADKMQYDNAYGNVSWVEATGIFALSDINQMEREMCGLLEWQFIIRVEDLYPFLDFTRNKYSIKPTVYIMLDTDDYSSETDSDLDTDTSNREPNKSHFEITSEAAQCIVTK